MKKFRIVLDFGHGGSKPGATYAGCLEKDVNLLLGQTIYQALHESKETTETLQVMLTRDADYDIPISTRVKLINEHHKNDPIQLVCSIHHNSTSDTTANGFECYYHESSSIGLLFSKNIVEQVRLTGTPIRNNGYITTTQLGRPLAMIHKINPPSILIEAGYLSNSSDRNKAFDDVYRNKLSNKIACGIWTTMRNKPIQ